MLWPCVDLGSLGFEYGHMLERTVSYLTGLSFVLYHHSADGKCAVYFNCKKKSNASREMRPLTRIVLRATKNALNDTAVESLWTSRQKMTFGRLTWVLKVNDDGVHGGGGQAPSTPVKRSRKKNRTKRGRLSRRRRNERRSHECTVLTKRATTWKSFHEGQKKRTEELEKELIVKSLVHLASTSGLTLGTVAPEKLPQSQTELDEINSKGGNQYSCQVCRFKPGSIKFGFVYKATRYVRGELLCESCARKSAARSQQ
jgi:hypothetical protein